MIIFMGSRRIHTYAASFGDDLAKQLINDNTKPGDLILDPFSGAATCMVQARILGRSAVGIDIDPVACLIARVITGQYTEEEIDELVKFGNEGTKDVVALASNIIDRDPVVSPGSSFSINGYKPFVPQNDSIAYWFSPIQRAVLAALMEVARTTKNQRLQAAEYLAISAAIIHKWPHTISLARDVDHSRPHRTEREDISVDSEIRTFRRCIKNIAVVLRNVKDALPESNGVYKVIEGDACEELALLDPGSVDYVLTSPPYFDAIDYPRAHKFSEWWLWPDREISSALYIGLKPGGKVKKDASILSANQLIPESMPVILPISELSGSLFARLVRYIVDLDKVISGLGHAIRTGGLLNLIIANNVVREVEIPVVELIKRLLEKNGFGECKVVSRNIASNRRRYPYGIRGFQGLMKTEYIISAVRS